MNAIKNSLVVMVLVILSSTMFINAVEFDFEYQPKKEQPKNEKKVESISKNKSENTFMQIDKTIQQYTNYLNELPKRLNQTKEQLNKYNKEGEEIANGIKSYLATVDICINKVQSDPSKELCNKIKSFNLGNKLKGAKNRIDELIEYTINKLEKIEIEVKDAPNIRIMIEMLKKQKAILTGE